jgi:hypothetical protein
MNVAELREALAGLEEDLEIVVATPEGCQDLVLSVAQKVYADPADYFCLWLDRREREMGTKNNPGAFDCYKAAELDEPMFVLLGRDPSAAPLVRLWAALREMQDEVKNPSKVEEAKKVANELEAWAKKKGKRKEVEAACKDLLDLMIDGDDMDLLLEGDPEDDREDES